MGVPRLKCRFVPHGSRDREKEGIRKDSSSAQFPVIRIVLSIAASLNFPLATLDIKRAYLQRGKLERDIFMVPPRGWARPSIVWNFLGPTYGLVKCGRLWQLTIERWMSENNIPVIFGLPQLFILRHDNRFIRLSLAKFVDDLFMAGPPHELSLFHKKIGSRFTVGNFDCSSQMIFNRLRILRHEHGAITLDMQEYTDTINQIEVTQVLRKEFDVSCTAAERKEFLLLAGSLNFLGHGVLTQASFAASYLQQRISRLQVSDLLLANHVLREVLSLTPNIRYASVPPLDLLPRYLAFSDASQVKTSYGQTGYVSGLLMPSGGGRSIYHVLDWTSAKQAILSFNSIGAEILAAALSVDREYLMTSCIVNAYGTKVNLSLVLTVDSYGLHSTITTLHEGRDYRLRPNLASLCDSFETGEISVLQWVQGSSNVADVLTKRNVVMFRKLNEIMRSGLLPRDLLVFAKRVTNSN